MSNLKTSIWLLLGLILGLSVYADRGYASSLSAQYAAAQREFDAGNYNAAGGRAAAILKRYPEHLPSRLMLGRIYYRTGRVKKAVQTFTPVDPSNVAGDAALEYTLAMFSGKKYRQSSRSWQRIPRENSMYDVGKFYGALSHVQLREWNQAGNALRSIERLPPAMESERRDLLRQLNNLRERDPHTYFTVRPYYVRPRTFAAQKPSEKKVDVKKDVSAPPPPEGWFLGATPKFLYERSSLRFDYHGLSESLNSQLKLDGSVAMTIDYKGAAKQNTSQPSLSLALEPGYTDLELDGQDSRITAFDDEDPTALQTVATKSQVHAFWAYIKAKATGVVPLNDTFDASAIYSYWDNQTNANPQRRIVLEQGPTFKLTADVRPYTIELSGAYLESFNYDDKTLETPRLNSKTVGAITATRNGESTVAKAMAQYAMNDAPLKKVAQTEMTGDTSLKKIWGSFATTVGATYVSREPYSGVLLVSSRDLDQPEQEMKGSLSTAWDVGFGLTFNLGGSYAQWDNYITAPLDVPDGSSTQKNVVANATVQTLSCGAAIAPAPWIALGASYDFTQRDFSVADDQMAPVFKQKVYDQKSLSKLSLALNYQF